MSDSDGDRTESATPKRRTEYRERGEVARSRELAAALGLVATLGALGAAGEGIAEGMKTGLRRWLIELGDPSAPLGDAATGPLSAIVVAVFPLLCVTAAAGAAGHLLQTGLMLVPKAIEFDLNKLNPLPKLGQIFSMRGLGELAKSLVKVSVVGLVVYRVVRADMETLSVLPDASAAEAAGILTSLTLRALAYGGFVLFILGALDYALARHLLEKKMRMTKQEVKDEHKREEGDPMIKGRIRGKQRQLARRRMMEAVKTADVVVTNPTHLAVALAYRAGEMGAPSVVAKGGDAMCERIKAVAREAGVPVLENKPLARALYKAVPIGREIPAALYRAVAEVLAYVYARKSGASTNAEVRS